MDQKFHWNLRKMFATDEIWKEEMQKAVACAEKIAGEKDALLQDTEAYRKAKEAGATQETAAASADLFVRLVGEYEEMEERIANLAVFAHSNFDQDMSNAAAKELFELAQNYLVEISEKLSFLSPVLMQYSPEYFRECCAKRPELKQYDFLAGDFFAKKAHILDDERETLLIRMDDLGGSFRKVFEDLTVNDITWETVKDSEGNEVEANEANYQIALYSTDRVLRERYWRALLSNYGKYRNVITSLYYGSVKNDMFEAKSRNYSDARTMAMSHNFIPTEVYDNLIRTVRENCEPMHEFVALRKEKLGVDQMHFYDLFVPIVSELDREYPYEEAQEIVLKATAVLGEDYTALVRRAFDERWIDVYPAKNKRSGAYSTGSYRSDPYVLLNYTGTLDDVFTLAHELGHSMHSYFSNHTQPLVYADYSIFCAEVASTLNEQLVSDYLYRNAKSDAERALLLDKKLNDLRSTFYRQTMFADFEMQTHQMAERGQPLLPDVLHKLHSDLNRHYYGAEFAVDEELGHEWSRIPHFYRAFYVYQYATGIAASTAIARRILTLGAPAVEDYRKFLCGGSSKHPIDMLRVAGVDMASPQPILDTIEEFSTTLEKIRPLL